MSFSTFRAEALAVCGIFAVLTSLYYLTTSKAPEDTRQSAAQPMRKNWNSSFTKQTCFLSGVPCIFPIEGTFFFVAQKFSGFFWCAGFKGGKPGTNWVSRKVELGDGGCQKMGRFAWGVGVAAASRELPKRFLDENWFWSYDWKVP